MKENSRRQEDSRRQENSRREESERKESLKISWKEMRRNKTYLSENHRGWKELDGKTLRRM